MDEIPTNVNKNVDRYLIVFKIKKDKYMSIFLAVLQRSKCKANLIYYYSFILVRKSMHMDRCFQQSRNGRSPTKWRRVSVQPIISLKHPNSSSAGSERQHRSFS